MVEIKGLGIKLGFDIKGIRFKPHQIQEITCTLSYESLEENFDSILANHMLIN